MSCYSRANKVCATCAHWGGNRNSVAGGFQVMPTNSTEKTVSRRRADHSYAAVPPQNAAAGWGCNTCVWHSSSDSRRRRSFAQHGTNNPLRLTDPKASTTIYVSPPAAIMAVLNPFGTFCFAVHPFRLPAACAAGAACKTLIGEKYESLHKAAGIGLFSDRKDNPSAVWEQPHTADAYQPLIQTGMRFP